MSQFVVGDRVRAVQDYAFGKLKAGEIYEISGILGSSNNEKDGPRYLLKDHANSICGYFGYRFKLAPNISSRTDQELADEYRTIVKQVVDIGRELENRGFKIYIDKSIPVDSHMMKTERSFRKEETKVIEL